MALTSSFSIAANASLTSALDLATATVPLQVRKSVSLASGTGAGQADKVFSDRRTLAASGSEDLDLAGVLLDAFGAAITWARVKGLFISAAAANTNSVIVGAASATQWATLLNAAGTITLRPGSSFGAMTGSADATGWAVTAGTGDLLKIANSAGSTSVTYDIVIIGASA
ncbi:hypothetical protein PV728_47420 [Streptomyces europaeiscabiei]|uniref:hypothetical protein n=1 Tax=Streptomyces europaeiscabiei TaxID=146819 RepID=UPI0029AB1104|nr:hypothetical protein [Streptomyces europaeiscabiei]MDX3637680.1 hypothetical protein [Streptomyces europaeiscabiei]MDX3655511.1 hypothetical protein [Streptomyces europaeiscabiei]